MLFIDPTQAFDIALREIAFGRPQGSGLDAATFGAQVEYLASLGVSNDTAEHIAAHIRDHGDVLTQWQVDPVVAELVRGLHTHAWFRVDDSDSIVETLTGGRQGCKLGCLVFCAVYAQALSKICQRLLDAHLSVEFTTSTSKAFWSTPDPAAPKINHASIEVTYVDDEAVAVTASSPAKLAKALSIIVQSYSEVFAAFGLEINWKKVKVRP